MYNADNSKPRKGFGLKPTHKCPKCGNETHQDKLPFLIVCSRCKEVVKGEELISIKDEM